MALLVYESITEQETSTVVRMAEGAKTIFNAKNRMLDLERSLQL